MVNGIFHEKVLGCPHDVHRGLKPGPVSAVMYSLPWDEIERARYKWTTEAREHLECVGPRVVPLLDNGGRRHQERGPAGGVRVEPEAAVLDVEASSLLGQRRPLMFLQPFVTFTERNRRDMFGGRHERTSLWIAASRLLVSTPRAPKPTAAQKKAQ
ncbi:hypothetical protein LY76DRAFT_593257 [Colletotrichum caudatum]|nr:hypothetical protein LY76DRAFT_593257 [Colletotrichum caudatum]